MSGTLQPRNSAGRVYWGYSSRPPVCDSSSSDASLPKAPGTDEILVPGERGDRVLEERRRDGIPLAAGTWRALGEAADRLGVALPATL